MGDIDADGILRVKALEKGYGKTEEIKKMVAEAEAFKADDDAQRARVGARNQLEQYAYQVKGSLADETIASKASAEDRAAVQAKVDEALAWLEQNQTAEKDEFEHMQKELEAVVNPVMAQLHGGGGSP